jgi:hypothetical protein
MCYRTLTFIKTLFIVALALGALANASTESTIWTFTETTNFWPQGGVLEDSAGKVQADFAFSRRDSASNFIRAT